MNAHVFHEVVGEGEPLFLLNGIMMTTASWAHQTAALSRDYRCILHDFRGQLRSEKPLPPYTMSMHVDDLRSLMDALEVESAHLVGTSYGGEVGMLFAGEYPERVRSLSLISCVARPDEDLRRTIRLWAETARAEPHRLWDVTLPFNYSPGFIAANREFVEAARERVAALPAEWSAALASLCEAFNQLDVPLDAIHTPTLVICGARDVLKPVRFSEAIAAAIPGAQLVVIEEAGHAVVLEKPAEVNHHLLLFLRDVDAAATAAGAT